MKKIFAMLLTIAMMMSLAAVAFAEEPDVDAAFSKTYVATNPGTESPAETFTFTFTGVSAVDGVTKESIGTCPAIGDLTVDYALGEAAVGDGLEKEIDVLLSGIDWPDVGIYTYDVREVTGQTAGVTYDDETLKLKVTVAYDTNTDTYYTAFVTLSLDDKEPEDGITDVKTGGFTNEYSAGTLSVSKTVTGNMGDQQKDFTVKVIFTAPEGMEMKSRIKYADDGEDYLLDPWTGTKEVSITLKHNEKVGFSNIPYGVTYEVIEEDYAADGYDAAQYDGKEKGEISSAAVETNITNNKGAIVDTGILMDSAPFVVMLLVAAVGLVLFTAKRRVQD